jgi:hypothetical protein
VRKYLKMPPRSALQLLGVLGLVAGVAWLGASLLGGGGEDGGESDASTALAFAGSQDAWVPGQPPLTDDPLYLQILGSATAAGDKRLSARVRLLELIEKRREAARRRAANAAKREAERQRRAQLRALARLRAQREAALRRAKAKYRQQLREAAEAERKRKADLARQKALLAKKRREAEEKRRIKPGEECSFADVQEQYDCEEGRQ